MTPAWERVSNAGAATRRRLRSSGGARDATTLVPGPAPDPISTVGGDTGASPWDDRALELMRRLPGRFFVVIDEAYTIRWASNHAGRVLGTDPAALCGRPAHEIMHPDDLETALVELGRMSEEAITDLQAMGADQDQPATMRLVTMDGSPVLVEFTAFNLFADPEVRALGLLGRVVSNRVRLDAVIDRLGTAAPLADVLGLLADHLAVEVPGNEHRIVRFLNGTAVHPDGTPALGDARIPPSVIHATTVARTGLTTVADLGLVPPLTQSSTRSTGLTTCFVHPITVQGQPDPIGAVLSWTAGTSLALGARSCIATIARLAGIAMAVHGTAAELRSAAMIDSLTGLGNRRQLDEWARSLIGPAAVLAVDLDRFKSVNDRHGNAAGDLVLAELARRLRTSCRPDACVARPGGDEFVVIIPGLSSAAQVEAVAARFAMAMRRPIRISDADLDVSASVGWAMRLAGEAMSDALARADASLYAMKAGRLPSNPPEVVAGLHA